MPFTATHVAAALPLAWLCRWRIPFSALAIGCMVNDLAVFFPELVDYEATHSLKGLVTHCLPIGLMGYYLYHWVLKRPLCALLPRRLSRHAASWVDRMPLLSPGAIAVVCVCILVGAATHVTWDAFTHGGRFGVAQFPGLRQIAFTTGGVDWRWYEVLQHGSSLLLLPPMVLGWWIWIRKQPVPTRSENAVGDSGGGGPQMRKMGVPGPWLKGIAWLAVAGIPLASWFYLGHRYPSAQWYVLIPYAVKSGGGLVILLGLLYCVVYTARDVGNVSARIFDDGTRQDV